jgi:hypothetical protein
MWVSNMQPGMIVSSAGISGACMDGNVGFQPIDSGIPAIAEPDMAQDAFSLVSGDHFPEHESNRPPMVVAFSLSHLPNPRTGKSVHTGWENAVVD